MGLFPFASTVGTMSDCLTTAVAHGSWRTRMVHALV